MKELPDIKDWTHAELGDWFVSLGESRFRGTQVFRWLISEESLILLS